MKFYFAPLEGITGYIYRNIYNTFFPNIDKYFTPFLSPNQNGSFSSKELNDILPEHNKGLFIVPQILTNRAQYFIETQKRLKEYGYEEVNLNLGCPSRTVVSKNKGAGFLEKKKELNRFLEEIFSVPITKISIKTRIGKTSPDEFYELIEIFNQYPLTELIIHPRIQSDFYNNKPNMSIFRDAVTLSKNRICYNGDIFTVQNYKQFKDSFPEIELIMLGRGLLRNPTLIYNIYNISTPKKEKIKEFHDKIYMEYQTVLSGDKNVLFKMKELWLYMIHSFTHPELYIKKIKKVSKLSDYEKIIEDLFYEQELIL